MTTNQFLQVLLFFVFICFSASLTGFSIIKLLNKGLEKSTKNLELVGASFLLGIGIFAYAFLILGVAGVFTKQFIWYIIFFFLSLSAINIPVFFKFLASNIKSVVEKPREKILSLAILAAVLAIMGSLYLSSMQPPYSTDEIAYHFPEALQIVKTHKVDFILGGHPFYGNIPKLMEVIFASGLDISNYELAHALNFAIFSAFVLVVFGFVNKNYGFKAAAISALLLVFFDDFTWNATSGYVDAATTAFEISSLLFILDWSKQKDRLSFFLSAIFIGIALSIKYSPIPTTVFILSVITTSQINKVKMFTVKKVFQILSIYILVAGVTGGYWYLKNLFIHGNPFYPLYFGHNGYSEIEFKSLIEAIQQFGPKTISHFFGLTSYFLNSQQSYIFFSIYLSPLFLSIKKGNDFRYPLFIYFVLYTIYWFFFATHQIRFLSTPLIVAIVMFSILISRLAVRHLLFIIPVLLATILIYSKMIHPIDYKMVLINFWNDKTHMVERQYALGNQTRDEFLTWKFGCQYSTIKFLENNNLEGNVIDNWSVWTAPNIPFYAQRNKFMPLTTEIGPTPAEINKLLASQNFGFLFYDLNSKKTFFNTEDNIIIQNREIKLPAEEYLIKKSKLIFQENSCYLYKLYP